MHSDVLFFFFQAEDGIRDIGVTGVQTCALPIWVILVAPGVSPLPSNAFLALNASPFSSPSPMRVVFPATDYKTGIQVYAGLGCRRSEEHTSELQSRQYLVCRLLLEKKKTLQHNHRYRQQLTKPHS